MEVRTGETTPFERIWAPHRAAYIPTAAERDGCPFCDMPAHENSLVVAASDTMYAVLNRHPYNPGHLMVVPRRHVADLTDLTSAESVELVDVTRQALRALRTVGRPQSFNVGLNLGLAAGASVAAHLHQHVVPRWTGDANFISVVGGLKVLPQLLQDTRDLLVEAWPADQSAAANRHSSSDR